MLKAIARLAVLGLLWTGALCTSSAAQISPDFSNRNIDYSYLPPKSWKYLPLFERVKQFRMLEQIAEFLSPLRLPHKYTLVTMECGVVNAFYQNDKSRTLLCYEFIEMLERRGPRSVEPSNFTYEEAIVGAFVGIIMHENGHAVFDMFDVPVFGREEDAADEMSIFIALQFNPEVARKIVRGFAYISSEIFAKRAPDFSDIHGTGLQRYYNALCLALGSDHPELFSDIDQSQLPTERAANCGREYQQVKAAFAKTVLPFIDQIMMKKVQARQWLKLTPQQAGLLNAQRQQQSDAFTLVMCNAGSATNVRVAIAAQLPKDPEKLQALGWFRLTDAGCDFIGSFRGDQLYWYARGWNSGKPWLQSAPDTDQTALKQCVYPDHAFELLATDKCEGDQKLVNFNRLDVDPSLTSVTVQLK